MDDRKQNHTNRAKLKDEFKDLYDRVAAILFEVDPIGINFEHNTDEYEPEVDTILPRLRSCASADDTQRVIHEEFVWWFGAESAGSAHSYSEIAERVWAEWLSFQAQESASEPMLIDCQEHGRLASAVVCCHLLDVSGEDPAGFIENSSDPHDLQAWCNACEAFYDKEGDLTDAFRELNAFSLVCVACYAEIRAHHSRPH